MYEYLEKVVIITVPKKEGNQNIYGYPLFGIRSINTLN